MLGKIIEVAVEGLGFEFRVCIPALPLTNSVNLKKLLNPGTETKEQGGIQRHRSHFLLNTHLYLRI